MDKKKYIFLLLLLLPFNITLSQGGLPLSGVNGWQLESVSPAPYGVFDTLNTGMQIVPRETGSSDSAELFRMTAYTRISGSENLVQFDFDKKFPAPGFQMPDSTWIDLKVNGTLAIEYAAIGIMLIGDSSWVFGQELIELMPNWQTLVTDWLGTGHGQLIHEVKIAFYLYAAVPSYVSTDMLLDNLVSFKNGNDTIVDNFGDDGPNSVEPISGIPNGFILYQNYPNPFNPITKIRYEISEYASVKLNVYSLLGEEVFKLINKEQPPGIYEIDFNGKNLPSGAYIYALSINGQRIDSRKMLLIK